MGFTAPLFSVVVAVLPLLVDLGPETFVVSLLTLAESELQRQLFSRVLNLPFAAAGLVVLAFNPGESVSGSCFETVSACMLRSSGQRPESSILQLLGAPVMQQSAQYVADAAVL